MRLKYARFYAFFRLPTIDIGRGAPEREDKKNKSNRKNKKDRENRKDRILVSPVFLVTLVTPAPSFTGIFLIPAP